MVSHQLATYGGLKHCGSKYMLLVSRVISDDHVIKGSCEFMGGSPSL